MLNRLFRIFVILLFVGTAASLFWWHTMSWTGQLRPVHPHFDGSCTRINGPVGAEDLVIDRKAGLVYVSSHDRRNKSAQGAIYIFPQADPSQVHKLPITGLAGHFAPHGLDLFVDAQGARHLFVVDHGDGDRILRFLVTDSGLRLEKTFTDKLVYSPNDVAAAGLDEIYVSNDSAARPGTLNAFVQALLRIKSGNLVHFKDGKTDIATQKVAYGNGVALADHGRKLYFAATLDQTIYEYDRDPDTGALTLNTPIRLGTGVDNLDVDGNGNIWVGAHPRILDFSAHAKDPASRAPSQVLMLDPVKRAIKEVYLSDGDDFSAVSVAARQGNHLYLGAVFDPGVMDCTMDPTKEPEAK